ncbi:hypothetical protein KKF82_05505 [Patescibacteria group bacterium]|nr:hypothetical protein [Patescibacteria group bacterium]
MFILNVDKIAELVAAEVENCWKEIDKIAPALLRDYAALQHTGEKTKKAAALNARIARMEKEYADLEKLVAALNANKVEFEMKKGVLVMRYVEN